MQTPTNTQSNPRRLLTVAAAACIAALIVATVATDLVTAQTQSAANKLVPTVDRITTTRVKGKVPKKLRKTQREVVVRGRVLPVMAKVKKKITCAFVQLRPYKLLKSKTKVRAGNRFECRQALKAKGYWKLEALVPGSGGFSEGRLAMLFFFDSKGKAVIYDWMAS